MALISLLKKKPLSLEDQLAAMEAQIQSLKADNKKMSTKFLSRLFPDTAPKPQLYDFPEGYVRVMDAQGEYYIVNNYGEKVKEDYHHLQQSPNSTHLQAAKEMGEGGDNATGASNYQGHTSPEEMDAHWDTQIQQIKPNITKTARKDLISDD